MELKEINRLPTSVKKNKVESSERNNADKRGIYDILISTEDDVVHTDIDNKNFAIINEERNFGNVCTLDWLQTWRSTEIS